MTGKVVSINKPTLPKGFSPGAVRFWQAVVADYDVSDSAGLELLSQACACLTEIDELSEQIRKDGLTAKGYRGQPRPHPLLKAKAEARRQFLACIKTLRLDIPT